jgi:hypothetical protein
VHDIGILIRDFSERSNMKNVRDHDRDMLIYHAHKVDKRTFADIGREFGISPERVRQVYRRTDFAINRENSDGWRRDEEKKQRRLAEASEN